jgi:hypothetical protein
MRDICGVLGPLVGFQARGQGSAPPQQFMFDRLVAAFALPRLQDV